MAYGLPPLWNWATNLNYGAGSYPWSAGPTKVAPSAPLIGFTPGTGASAPEMNYNLNALANQDALLLQFGGLNPAKNWQLPFTIDANESVDMAWNQVTRVWMYVEVNTSTFVWRSYQLTGTDATPSATTITIDTEETILYGNVFCDANGWTYLVQGSLLIGLSPGGSSWVTVDSAIGSGGHMANGQSLGALGSGAWAVICWGGGGAIYGAGSSGAAHSYTNSFVAATATTYCGASSGNYALWFGQRANDFYYQGTISTSTQTACTSFLGATDVPIDICYDNQNARFVLAVSVGGTAVTSFWASVNSGVSWTKLSTINSMIAHGTALGATALRCIGSLYVAYAYNLSYHQAFLAYSVDAVNWFPSDITLYSASLGYSTAGGGWMRASDTQFAIMYTNQTALQAQFSTKAGLPASQLS